MFPGKRKEMEGLLEIVHNKRRYGEKSELHNWSHAVRRNLCICGNNPIGVDDFQ